MTTCVVVKARYTRDGRLISRSTRTGPSSMPEMADQAVKALLAVIDIERLRRDGLGCRQDDPDDGQATDVDVTSTEQ